MRYVTTIMSVIFAFFITLSLAYAEGDVERGKSLFIDSTLGGSKNDKSCNSCHYNGSGLEKSANKKYEIFMNVKVNSLEDVVNICIERPLSGKALDKNSQKMKDIVAYIKSLGEK
jgi:cytochrome c